MSEDRMTKVNGGLVFRGLIQRAQSTCFSDDDYIGEDGLRYCSKCHTPVECRSSAPAVVKLFGEPKVFPIPCACRRAAIREEDERKRKAEEEEADRRRRARAFALPSWRACTFDADDGSNPKLRRYLEQYLKRSDEMIKQGIGIMLTGEPGCGKTFYAACLTNAFLEKGYRVQMTSIGRLQSELEADFGENAENVLCRIRGMDLLVLDDVGTERNTSYGREMAYKVINERYESGKPLAVTTNLAVEEMQGATDMAERRMYGRIIEMCPIQLRLRGNRRDKIAKSKLAATLELFREEAKKDAP